MEAVLTEKRGRVLLVTLNRPEAMNAVDGAWRRGWPPPWSAWTASRG